MITDLLYIVAPVFLVLIVGYSAARFGGFDQTTVDGIMRFAQGFAVPCLLFLSVYRMDLATHFSSDLLLSFYTGALICFALGTVGARVIFKRRPGEAVAVGFAALFANSVLLGLPITERAYGPDALVANFVIVSIHAPVCYLVGMVTMEMARADGRSLSETLTVALRSLARTPIMIGLALGFVANLLHITLFEPLEAAVDMVASAALPAALFGLGAVLYRYRLGERLAEAGMVIVLSLLVHPLIVAILGVQVLPLTDSQLKSAVVTAAMAPGINAYLFANLYKRAEGTAATAVLVGTAVSVLTASGWLWWLGL
ncbi:MAG: AEC family transporter [Pseudomonadota bacterium]